MPRRSTIFRSVTPCVLIVCAGALVGCDLSGSEATAKIEGAARTITNVSPTQTGEERASAFGRASSELRDLSSVESAKDAASVLTAQATAGSAQVTLELAQQRGAELLSSATEMRRQLQGYVRLAAQRDGLAAQDFSSRYASLDDEARELSDDLDGERSRLACVESELARLGDEREQRVQAARDLRGESIRLKRSVQDASATERQPVLEQALEISGRADARDSEAARLQIEIDDAMMRQRSISSEIELLEQQRENNEAAREEAQKLERQVRQSLNQLRSETDSLGRSLLEQFETLLGDYESGAKASYEEAASGFSRAAGEASRGSSVQGARMSSANIRLMEASALVHRASIERALAALGADMVAVLPAASSLAQRVEALGLSADEALTQAADTYESASAALEGASERANEIRVMLGLVDETPADQDAMDEDGFDG